MGKKRLPLFAGFLVALVAVGSLAVYVASQSGDDEPDDTNPKGPSITEVVTPTPSENPEEEGIMAAQFLEFIPGVTTQEEVKSLVGEPQQEQLEEYDSAGDTYLTADGCTVVVYYTGGTVEEVAIWHYPKKENITLEQFTGFVSGVSTEYEVKSVVGEPHDYFGYGFVRDVYYTVDGDDVFVLYTGDVLYSIEVWHSDGTDETLVPAYNAQKDINIEDM